MSGLPQRSALALLALVSCAAPVMAEDSRAKAPATQTATTEALTLEAINGATLAKPDPSSEKTPSAKKTEAADRRPQALLVKVQVLLDRAHFSPGAIDGRDGENLRGALSAFAVAQGLPPTATVNPELLDKLTASSGEPVAVTYTITEADVAGPFVEAIPPKMEDQGKLDRLGYTNPREMLAERFHMSRDLLSALNPDAALDKAGTVITVASVPPLELGKPKSAKESDKAAAKDSSREGQDSSIPAKDIARIEVDKTTSHVRAFDKDGTLRAFYPASIGSEEKPAPSGETKVKGVAFEPTYTYNPKYKFKGVKAKETFQIKPGPNNPVGLVWIDLAIPSYGIHGTPEPEKVGKTESHGCIRLTNWDVRDLATRVERGAKVVFKDD